jgi:copper(I)-binding protein
VLTAAAALTLSACSSGQVTQTSTKVSSVQGVNATIGDIAIRNAAVAFPADGAWRKGSAPDLSLRLVNTGSKADRLIGVSSTVAAFAQLAEPKPSGSASASASASASPAASASASPSASVSPSASTAPSAKPSASGQPSASPSLEGPPKIDLELLPGELVALDQAGRTLTLQDLTQDVQVGHSVEVTLTFERAGEITLRLPILPPLSAQPRASAVKGVEEHAKAEEGEH